MTPKSRLMAMSRHARPLVIAHRGSAWDHPENTHAAFAAAIAAGADAIELDVRLSADGAVVVAHDADLMRCGGMRRAISAMTWAELKAVDVGRWFHPRFAGERVPLLSATLRAFARTTFFVELKPARRNANALAAATVAVIRAARALSRVQVLCFSAVPLAVVQRLAPTLPLVRNAERVPRELRTPALAAVDLDQRAVTPAAVAQLHALGMKVFTYTVDTRADLRRVVHAGVDGVISNRPAWLREELKKSAEKMR